MKPYYEANGIAIYHGDCRDILPEIPTVDLLLTDPPYGVAFSSGRGKLGSVAKDQPEDQPEIIQGLQIAIKQLRRSRHVYIFGKIDLSSLPLCGSTELIWDKQKVGMGNLKLPWGPQHEVITFATHEPSKANREKRGYGKLSARLRKGSVLRCLRHNGKGAKRHPTEKPIDILRQMIESSSVLGECVLDPYMGSGSTLVAAAIEGRTAIGIEIEEKYCEIAVKRLKLLPRIVY
jgi:site-specific DNA-methyltransferase (adenine-specific)